MLPFRIFFKKEPHLNESGQRFKRGAGYIRCVPCWFQTFPKLISDLEQAEILASPWTFQKKNLVRYVGCHTLHQIQQKQTSLKTNSQTYVVELKNVFRLALDTHLVAHEYMSLILEYCLLFMKNLLECVKHWLRARLKKCSGQNLAKLFSKYRRQLCVKHLHLSDWDFNQWAKSGCKRYNFF